jgi:hypothetical protein
MTLYKEKSEKMVWRMNDYKPKIISCKTMLSEWYEVDLIKSEDITIQKVFV